MSQFADEPLLDQTIGPFHPAGTVGIQAWVVVSAGVHVPSLPAAVHVSHSPSHDVLQHTESTQWPLSQVSPDEHAVPF